jgi:hypothetical protein
MIGLSGQPVNAPGTAMVACRKVAHEYKFTIIIRLQMLLLVNDKGIQCCMPLS